MGPRVDLLDPFARQVGVQLGGRNTRMPEQFLDDPQVRAALEQVRGERVAQRVWRDVLIQARPPRRVLDGPPGGHAPQTPATARNEERSAAGEPPPRPPAPGPRPPPRPSPPAGRARAPPRGAGPRHRAAP